VYELAKPFLNNDSTAKNQFDYFRSVFQETQKKRFEQIAGITALTPHFPSRNKIAEIFQSYIDASFRYMMELEQFVIRNNGKYSEAERKETVSFLDKTTIDLREQYDRMLNAMKKDITSEESRYEKIFN
jgi:hypothetical protein